ncbi:uncharacterized protein [Primulina eburnea]|uniref:uncharacterized protein n=1 Tax=Primulina eburnea TaxID=1245227 RepID=UPI003C6BF524
MNQREKEVAATSIWKAHVQQVLDKLKEEEEWDTYGTEVVQEEEYKEDELQVDELLMAPSQMEDGQHEVQDPLEEINLGELENPKMVYVSKLLEEQLKQDLISMLKEYKDCFAWSYDDMPGEDKRVFTAVEAQRQRGVQMGRVASEAFDVIKRYYLTHPFLCLPGQAIADFLADHPSLDEFIGEQVVFPVCGVGIQPWELKFDESNTETTAGAGIVITSPRGVKTALSFNLNFPCTNNQAEYEALVSGLEILKDLGAKELLISGDSQLLLKQLSGEFKCTSLSLAPYYTAASQLLDDFEEVSLVHVPRQENWEADELTQVVSILKMSPELTHRLVLIQKKNHPPELTHRLVLIQKKNHPSIQQRGIQADTLNLNINLVGDWRDDMKQVLESTGRDIPHGLKMRTLNYVLVEGDLYRKGLDGLLLRCIGFPEALEIMKQVHEGVCGAHQSGVKMRWLIRRYGYYWPSILKDSIKYAKGCQPCQKHGNIQRIPTDELHSVVKPWPFKGWAMDLIGKIYPASSKGHSFILVATYFFNKRVEAVPLKKAEQGDVINFVKENIINRFGIPESLATDQGTMFTSSDMKEFAEEYGVKLRNSSSHYPQSNGQAEASNKNIQKECHWSEPFSLTFGHDAVLPLEIMVPSMRVARQNEISLEHYNEAMLMELEELDELRIKAYNALLLQK